MNDGTRKCVGCKKELSILEGHSVPLVVPATVFFNIDSGGVEKYCDKCYKDIITGGE